MSLSRYLSKLAGLLNSSGQVPAAGLASTLDLSTKNVTLPASAQNNPQITVKFAALPNAATSAAGWLNIGSIFIPSPGIWKVTVFPRIKWGTNGYFIVGALSTSSTSGSGLFTSNRMLLERLSNNGFGNIGTSTDFIVDVPNGMTSGVSIYFQMYFQSADGNNANYNDSNGVPYIMAERIKDTTTSGTSVSELSSL